MADAFLDFLNCDFNGVAIGILIALVLGLILACHEGIWFKFKQFVKTEGDGTERFNQKYLISGLIAIIVCFATVWFVWGQGSGILCGTATDLAGQIENMIVAFVAVLTEALVLIKLCNRRLDTLFLDSDVSDEDKAVAKEVVENKATEMKFRTL